MKKTILKSIGITFICSIVIFTIYFIGFPMYSYSKYKPMEGDIIFQSLPKVVDLVIAIEGVTSSKYSHVGIVIKKDNKWYVREAMGVVKDTPLRSWIARGRQAGIDVYRIKNQSEVKGLIKETNKYMGLKYDVKYKMDDEEIYCSELIYKAYKDSTNKKMGKLYSLGEMNWKPYKKIIEKYEEGDVPINRKMITPRDLAKSKYIEKVLSVNMW